MRAHTIATKASTIVSGGILALGLAVVLLAATASTASAGSFLYQWNCPPPPTSPTTLEQIPLDRGCLGRVYQTPGPSFDFGDRQVGTTSPARRLALGVSGETFTPNISVSGDYAQTNNCPPTLSAGAWPQIQGCLINVTFAPTGIGRKHGTLSTGPGGPTTALTGNGCCTPGDPPPDLQLSGKKKQSPVIAPDTDCGRQKFRPYVCGACDGGACAVRVKVSCGDEKCTARATGRLTNVKHDKLKPDGPYDIAPGKKAALAPHLTKKTRKKAGKAIDDGKNVKAKVTVRATDAAGNLATAKRTIRLVK